MLMHGRQGGFAGGEVSPDLAYRADISRFSGWLKSCKNFFILQTGAAVNRPGTYFMGYLPDENVRLLPFMFSLQDSCVAAMTPQSVRFFTAQGPVLDAQDEVYAAATPYDAQDLKLLNWEQVYDVLYLACPNKPPKTLTRYAADDWKCENYAFTQGPFLPLDPQMKGWLSKETQNGETKVFLNSMSYDFTSADVGNIFKLRCFFPAQSLSKKIDATADANELKNNIVCAGGGWTFKTAGTWNGEIILQYSEDGETWKDYQTFSSADGGSNWSTTDSFSEVFFLRLDATAVTAWPCKVDLDVLSFESNVVGKVTALVNEHKVQVSLQDLANKAIDYVETLSEFTQVEITPLTSNTSSSMFSLYMAGAHQSNYISTDTANAYKSLDGQDGTAVKVYASGNDGEPTYFGWTFDKAYLCSGCKVTYRVPGWTLKLQLEALCGDEWRLVGGPNPDHGLVDGYYQSEWIFDAQLIRGLRLAIERRGSGGSYETHYMMINEFYFELFQSTAAGYVPQPLWEGAWSEKNGWPRCVCSTQGRLAWGTGARVDISKTDDLTNFGTSIPIQDDDAISATVAGGGLNDVLHLIGGRQLTALTAAAEFVSDSEVLTPQSPGMTKQGNRGAAQAQPAVVGNRILFAQSGGSVLRDMAYDWQGGGYDSEDLTVCVRHLFEQEEIKRICYQQSPYSLVWVLTQSGKLYCCTYLKQEEVLAWSRFETDGTVLDVCVLSREDGDELWLAVKRGEKVCLEKMTARRTDAAEQFFVDCGRTSRNDTPLKTHGGFEHLNGRNVWVLADGHFTRAAVQNGQIDLPFAAKTVHAGLAYEMELETLSPDVSLQDGTAADRKKRVVAVLVAAVDSAGGYVQAGKTPAPLRPLHTDILDGSTAAPQTFDTLVTLPSSSLWRAGIKVGQDSPRALCVSALLPRYSLGDA